MARTLKSQKIVQTLTYTPPDDGEMWMPKTYTGYQLYQIGPITADGFYDLPTLKRMKKKIKALYR